MAQLATLELPSEDDLLVSLLRDVQLGLAEASGDERRALLELLRVRLVILDRDHIHVEWLLDPFVITSAGKNAL